MKKLLAIGTVLIIFAYIVYQNKNGLPISSSLNKNNTVSYKDGAYTGKVEDAFYGNIQVKTIISGGKISDIEFLQYPSDRDRSVAINTMAMPNLKQEAIQLQSANVDMVSGATASSQAFVQSLQSSLDQARI